MYNLDLGLTALGFCGIDMHQDVLAIGQVWESVCFCMDMLCRA